MCVVMRGVTLVVPKGKGAGDDPCTGQNPVEGDIVAPTLHGEEVSASPRTAFEYRALDSAYIGSRFLRISPLCPVDARGPAGKLRSLFGNRKALQAASPELEKEILRMERATFGRVTVALGVVLCCLAAPGLGSAAAQVAGNPCGELPASLRSVCVAPGVHCTVHADAHRRWEAVFGTEPTMAKAEVTEKRAAKLGFGPLAIEADVRCSNGSGVYEVARARFTSHAAAAALAAQAKAKGLSGARTEDS
jgi:hypothetical protein